MNRNKARAPRLSLCMIARNESENIADALASAKPFCDEMIVVDTGSTDATPELAAAGGARVAHAVWDDDFAAARNAALDLATGDFVLILDADERLDEAAGREIRTRMREADVLGMFVPIVNWFDDGAEITALVLRVFRNVPEARWTNRIHEQILPSLEQRVLRGAARLINVGGRISHGGYRPEVMDRKGKNARNLRVFERAVADRPDDLYLRYKFADFLRRWPEKLEQTTKLLESGVAAISALPAARVHTLPFAAEFFALLAQIRRDAGEIDAALELCEAGMLGTDPTANLRFMHASVALVAGDARTAATGFRACLELEGAPQLVPGQPGATGLGAAIGLTQALIGLDLFEDARAAAEDCCSRAPERGDLLDLWLAATRRCNAPQQGLRFLVGRLQANAEDAAAWSVGGDLLFGLGLFAEARNWLLRAAALVADAGPLLALHAEAHLHECDLENALASAAAAPVNPHARAIVAIVSLAAGLEVPSSVDCLDPDVRTAFERVVQNLRRTSGIAVAQRLDQVRAEASVFDPAGMSLLVDALGA